jgi:ABC-type dipeptide/oligopeptide/nickel transport system ATPase component
MTAGADTPVILNINNLKASYEEFSVLNNVSLKVRRGEVLCIVGESGSGKSTLIKAVCSDPKLKIDEGTILYGDRDLTSLKNREMRKLLGPQIGLIQQNPWGAFNPLRRIGVQFKETFKSHGKDPDFNSIKELFGVLGLRDPDSILKMRPYELSGGMSQRIAIAAAFALEPELLLCDEITSALDVTTATAVTEQLLELKRSRGTTIVLVTHNLGMAKCIADRIAIMYRGEIVECADASKILTNPENDYTKRLLKDVPRILKVG